MRRTPIRMKLAAALAVPLLGLFLITVVEVVDTAREVERVRSQTELARASIGPSGLITSLQNERTWAAVELIGQETSIQPPIVGYDESRRATDQAVAAFRDTLSGEGGNAPAVYAQPLANLAELAELREKIDASTTTRDLTNIPFSDEIYAGYAQMIRPFLDANTQVALAIDDAQLRQVTSLVDTTTRQVETLSDLARASIIEIVLGGGLNEADEIAATAKLKAVFDKANDELREAPDPYDEVVAATFPEDLATGFSEQLDAAIAGDAVDMASILATLDVPAEGGYMGIRQALVTALNDRADDLNAAAEARERLYIAMAMVTLAAAIGLSWLVSRSITKPLRALTRQAKDMADHRLPDAVSDILETPLGENVAVPHVDPVRVRTSDEVSDVADALNTVQDTALDLAVEQAVLRRNIADSFVNLGRRNQNLLGRQLDFITELETNEADADALANLFRLDHLATRMRRNAESLLVLAGIEPPRQWAAPVRLTDVIRAALGEVEDYQRVTVRGAEPATILGSAAADLAHLLAELIENALVFSPPDQTVDIRGRNRNDGGYTLAIIDSGLGMAATDVAAANRRLAGAESFTIAPSKYLGHYVAGNLAARHDIKVHLDNSPSNGVTATITVPPMLLTTEQVTAAPVTPPHGHQLAQARALAPPQPAPLPPSPPQHLPGVASPDGWAVPQLPRAAPQAQPPAPPAPPSAPPAPAPATAAHPLPSLWPRSLPLSQGQRAPNGQAPAVPAAGHGIGNGAAPPPSTTPGGLARRAPGPRVTSAAAPVDDNLLAALGRYTSPRPAPGAPDQQPGGGLAPPTPSAPAPSPQAPAGPAPSPLTPPDALTRRVRGAQLPQAAMISLRGGRVAPPPRPALDPLSPGASKATDVQALLSSFTAGVRRGLDEARQRAAHATGPLSTVDSAPRRAGW